MHDLIPRQEVDFLAGGGEMGALMRAHDWSGSPLGAPREWPQSLRTVVGLMINSRHPMFVAWGPKLAFLYNDGYAPIFGAKHPRALGLPFREVWSEIWDDIWPLIERALAGEATWSENLHLVMQRNGYPEDTWYTFSYSPVRDEEGRVAGMFCTCTETTGKVVAERRAAFLGELDDALRPLSAPQEIMARAAEKLGRHLGLSCVGYAETDPSGEPVLVEGDWRVPGFPGVAALQRLDDFGPAMIAELRAGRVAWVNDTAVNVPLPGEKAEAPSAVIRGRALVAAPLIKNGRLAGTLFALAEQPRMWTNDEIALIEDVAERAWAALQQARAEATLKNRNRRLALLAKVAGRLVLGKTPHDQLKDAFDDVAEEVGASVYFHFMVGETQPERLRLENSRGLDNAERQSFETIGFGDYLCGRIAQERRPIVLENVHLDTDERTAAVRALCVKAYAGVPLIAHGRIVGTLAYCSTDAASFSAEHVALIKTVADQIAAAVERDRLEKHLSESEERLGQALEAGKLGAFEIELASHKLTCTDQCKAIFGRDPGEALSWDDVASSMEPADLEEVTAANAASLAATGEYRAVYRCRRPDGSIHWIEAQGRAVARPDGVHLVGVNRDVTEAREAAERQRLLTNELNHRVKNTLAIVQAIASQTARFTVEPEAFQAAFGSRVVALARVHDVLTKTSWNGAMLGDIAEASVAPFKGDNDRAISIAGPPVVLDASVAVVLSLGLHELATNATKYGALKEPGGFVTLDWELCGDPPAIRLEWAEHGGPPVTPPTRQGFGRRIIEAMADQLGGEVDLAYHAAGVRCRVSMPLADQMRGSAAVGP